MGYKSGFSLAFVADFTQKASSLQKAGVAAVVGDTDLSAPAAKSGTLEPGQFGFGGLSQAMVVAVTSSPHNDQVRPKTNGCLFR